MRLSIAFASTVALGLATISTVRACEPAVATCPPRLSIFPAYTPEGLRIGTVEAPVRRLPRLERSRFTGQPLTVVFNDPDRIPGTIDPTVTLVPLPRVAPFRTQAVYPRGY